MTITEDGKPVGRIVPMKPSLEDKLQQLADAGVLAWSGKKLRPQSPSIKPKGGKTLSDLLVEDRG